MLILATSMIRRRTVGIVLLVVTVLLGICAILLDIEYFSGSRNHTVTDVSTISREEIDEYSTYYIPQFIFLDAYAMEDRNYYCVGAFFDKDGQQCIVPIEIATHAYDYKDVEAYLEEGEWGTYWEPMYVEVKKHPDDDDLVSWRDELLEEYKKAEVIEDADVIDNLVFPAYSPNLTRNEVEREKQKEDVLYTGLFNVIFIIVGAVAVLLILTDSKEPTDEKVSYENRYKTRW
ncbi:MAG: hypothetical protein K6G04_08185 [Lachnospiraceae bacterium]|nr:hypothetical protein [Lachnospiraceae bacterium]